MERLQAINSDRIRWCCEEVGITPAQLADDLDISEATMTKVIEGTGALTFRQLSRVANYFGRGALFFLEEGPVTAASVHSPQFRTLTNQKPDLSTKVRRIIEQAEKQREIFVSLREGFEEGEVTTRFNPPNLENATPREAARRAREWLQLGEFNTFDSFRAAVEAKGVLVFRSNGYGGKWQIPRESPILGFNLFDPICPVIVIRKQRAPARQSFTLMHELGHILLHRSSSIDDEHDFHSRQGMEQAANAFAGHLLVPDQFLLTIKDDERPDRAEEFDEWLAEKRSRWGVSGEVILRRLLDAGRLQAAEYAAYRQWWAQQQLVAQEEEGGSRQYRHREPKHLFGDAFVKTILGAMNAKQITLTKASNYLDGLKLNDLHLLDRHYAGA
jgi:Zn-dependent peptidase ImmA (M78 family)